MRRRGRIRPPLVDANETLLLRYRELTARYKSVIERLNRDARSESAFYKLSWFALQRSSSALAMFRDGHVVLANARWHALASARHGAVGWSLLELDDDRTYSDLGSLGAAELARLSSEALATTFRCRRRDGAQILRIRLENMPADGGDSVGLLLADDVTAEMASEGEIARMRDAMLKREQMSAIGRVAAGAAHDIGNTLNALALRVTVLRRSLDESGRARLSDIDEAIEMMRRTLDRLDRVGGRRSRPQRPIDVRAVVRSAIQLAGLNLAADGAESQRIAVVLQLPQRLPRVAGDAAELTNVFLNLLINARDAMVDGGTVTISAARTGNRVTVRVVDEGPGFPVEQLARVFEPFFTTKGARGSGLGLSLAYGYMKASGGSIRAGNRDGGGAEVVLELPLVRPPISV